MANGHHMHDMNEEMCAENNTPIKHTSGCHQHQDNGNSGLTWLASHSGKNSMVEMSSNSITIIELPLLVPLSQKLLLLSILTSFQPTLLVSRSEYPRGWLAPAS